MRAAHPSTKQSLYTALAIGVAAQIVRILTLDNPAKIVLF
jgi:hypothetical protein